MCEAAGCITGQHSGLEFALRVVRRRTLTKPTFEIRWAKGDVVLLLSSIAELLKRERIPYTCFRHLPAYTAQEEAAVSHIPQHCWAKVVICVADDQPVQAVLPAHAIVDLEQLRALANAAALRLAHEDEISALYAQFEVGAMPPFGA